MKYPKRNTKLWNYLNQIGVLEIGDAVSIKNAIKAYYRNYDMELKQRKRKVEKRSFTISFPNKDIQHIRFKAKKHYVSIIDYIKLVVMADVTGTSLAENTLDYKMILQLLQYYKNVLDELETKETKKWFRSNNYEELHKILTSIKNEILIKKI